VSSSAASGDRHRPLRVADPDVGPACQGPLMAAGPPPGHHGRVTLRHAMSAIVRGCSGGQPPSGDGSLSLFGIEPIASELRGAMVGT